MGITKAKRAVLSAGKTLLLQDREKDRRQRRRTELFFGRRQRAGSLFKKQLLERAIHIAGIDQRRLAEQQQRDQKAVIKYLTVERKTALAAARRITCQQNQVVADRKKRWDRVLGKRNAPLPSEVVSQYLDTATEITLSGEGTTSIAPGQNLVHTRVDVSSGGYLGGPMKGAFVNIDWHFLWSVPQDGLLNATSFLQLNGANWLAVNADCNGGFAQSSLIATLGVTQLDSAGQPHHDAQTADLLDQDIQTSWGDSLGKVQFIALDETDTVGGGRAFQFPVTADLPILMTVSVQLYVSVWNAQAAMDFMSGAYRLNVPFVFLTVNGGTG